MDGMMEVDLDDLVEQGRTDGWTQGLQLGQDEGWTAGMAEGAKLGNTLGTIMNDALTVLQSHPSLRHKASRLMTSILEMPLTNDADPDKEQRLLRLHARHKELCALCGIPGVERSEISWSF